MNYNCRLISQKKMIVSSVCYVSPLQELKELAIELAQKHYRGAVLFDLLCVNGNNSNRFISIQFNGSQFDRSTAKPIENPNNNIVSLQKEFYKENNLFISNSVLSSKDKEFFQLNNSPNRRVAGAL